MLRHRDHSYDYIKDIILNEIDEMTAFLKSCEDVRYKKRSLTKKQAKRRERAKRAKKQRKRK